MLKYALYKRLQRVLFHPCNYTTHGVKQHTGLCRVVSVNLPHSSAHNTAAAQTAYIPPTQRWRAYHQAQHLRRYQIPAPRRTLYRPAQPPYYNKVYKGAAVRRCYGSMPDGATYLRPFQPGGGFDASHARRLEVWHRVSGKPSTLHQAGQSSSKCAAGGAEPLTAATVSLFGLSPDSQ